MNVHHSLICFFFLSLRDRNTGVISAETNIHTGTEGGNITVACSFYFPGRTKIFCKEECEERDFLLQTDDVKAQSGRYSIAYEDGNFLSSTILYVSITKLTRSDAGKYRCGLHRSLSASPSYDKFEIRVKDAPISSEPNQTVQPNSTCVSSTCSSAQTGAELYVRLTLVVMFTIVVALVLIFFIKKATKPKESPVECLYADIIEASGLKLLFPPQYRAPQSTAPPCGSADYVVYSVPMTEVSLDSSHAEDASTPLYATVTLHQL